MKNIKFRIYGKLIVFEIFMIVLMRFLIPVILNYPPDSEIPVFQLKIEPMTHNVQYLVLGLTATILNLIFMTIFFKNIFNYLKKDKKTVKYSEIEQIRKECQRIPNRLIVVQVILLLIMLITLFIMVEMSMALWIKFLLAYFSFFMASWIISIVLVKGDLNKIIEDTYKYSSEYKIFEHKSKFYKNLIFNLLPFFLVIIVTISLFGYAKTTEKVGESGYYIYKQSMSNLDLDGLSLDEIKDELKKINLKSSEDYYFIINDDIRLFSNTSGNISNFFLEYAKEYINQTDGRIYEYYGVEEEGYAKYITTNTGEKVFAGFKYSTTDLETVVFFTTISLAYILIYIVILIIWSKNISNNISNISNKLLEISNNKDLKENNIIPIISNDELGELADSYNKIQAMTKKNQVTMVKQAELSTLGEVAGGIAHDLNSPLMAISLDIDTIKKYINSDKVQSDENTKQKLQNMLLNISSSLKNMGQTINSVRDQIRDTADTGKIDISLLDTIKQIHILTDSQFRRLNCKFINNINEDILIYGEKNKLYRIISNLIKNSLDAYEEKNIKGEVQINLNRNKDYYVLAVADKAGGIPKDVASRILKEKVSTKKEKGTGIGIFNSNALMETAFNGKLSFETKDGIGTTFYIEIPRKIIKGDILNGKD